MRKCIGGFLTRRSFAGSWRGFHLARMMSWVGTEGDGDDFVAVVAVWAIKGFNGEGGVGRGGNGGVVVFFTNLVVILVQKESLWSST